MAIKTKLPQPQSGYELGADRYGYFSVVVPEEKTINYIKNPVFNTNFSPYSYRATGSTAPQTCYVYYTAVNATIEPKDRPMSITGAGAKVSPVLASSKSMSIYYTTTTLSAGTYTLARIIAESIRRYITGAEFYLTVQYGETVTNLGGRNGFKECT